MWSKADWGVWLPVAWTVVVAGVLVIWDVYVALSPDNDYVSNGAVELFSILLAVGIWMLGLFLGVVVFAIAGFLVDHHQERVARAQQGRVDSPDLR
jgi:hypothetical protein